MGKKYNGLAVYNGNFSIGMAAPVDDRLVVDSYTDLSALSPNIYEGMLVYVSGDTSVDNITYPKGYYYYDGTSWEEFESGGSAISGTIGGVNKPIYFNSGVPTECGVFATLNTTGETAINLNDDLNTYTTVGVYSCSGGSSGSTIGNSLSNSPVSIGFKLVVQNGGTDTSYVRQILYAKDNSTYTRTGNVSNNTWTWTSWSKFLYNGLTLDSVSDGTSRKLANYVAKTGDTMTGALTLSKIRVNATSSGSNTTNGIYYYNGTTDYLLIGQGSSNLWIGSNESNGTHHTGGTYISSGSGETYISRLVSGTRTNYKVLDKGNTYISSGKGYIDGTEITTVSRVSGSAGTANSARHVWFSDGSTETVRNYDDHFKYNPSTDTLSIAGAAVTAVSSSSTPTAYRNMQISRTINTSSSGNTTYNEKANVRGLEISITNKVYGSGTAESVMGLYCAVLDSNGNEQDNGYGYSAYFIGKVRTGKLIPTSIQTSGTITSSSSITGQSVYQSSDDRLKDYKGDFHFDINKLNDIPLKYFTFKEGDVKKHIGTSAQSVKGLIPEIVNENESGFLSVDYSKLSLVAIDCIKQLKSEIESLKAEIVELKRR